jgi:hypothetical protein
MGGMKTMLSALAVAVLVTGCAAVYTRTRPYLGVPHYAATDPNTVRVLSAEPKDRLHHRLGEVFLDVSGSPKKETLDKKLRVAAAKLGAEAVFVVHDQMRIFPVVYVDWWGPVVSPDAHRTIIAVAIRYR